MLRAVATDGHRLAQAEMPRPPGATACPASSCRARRSARSRSCSRTARRRSTIELSHTKIRFTIGDVVLTSKLIDGTFPDYERVIPHGNDKELTVDKAEFEAAVDRVSTISTERGRAVKLVAQPTARWCSR